MDNKPYPAYVYRMVRRAFLRRELVPPERVNEAVESALQLVHLATMDPGPPRPSYVELARTNKNLRMEIKAMKNNEEYDTSNTIPDSVEQYLAEDPRAEAAHAAHLAQKRAQAASDRAEESLSIDDHSEDILEAQRVAEEAQNRIDVAQLQADIAGEQVKVPTARDVDPLIKHAQREMELVGLFGADSDYGGMLGSAVMELIRVFSKQGHSGFSAGMTIQLFETLANYKALSDLTNDPREWHEVGDGVWQNVRQSSVFSKDGGLTYKDLSSDETVTAKDVR